MGGITSRGYRGGGTPPLAPRARCLPAPHRCEPFAAGEIDEYIYNNGLGATEASAKNAINTQAWILHLTNPSECWANLRRSGYPRLLNRDNYTVYEYTIIDGPETPVRLKYPQLESKYNSVNYEEAIGRMGGTDNWHSHVWWDKE